MTVSPELARIYVTAPIDDYVIETLQISHHQFTEIFYITNHHEDIELTLEDGTQIKFRSFPFEIQLPSSGQNGFQDIVIAISNIGAALINELELASELVTQPVLFTYRAYSSTELTTPGFTIPRMSSSDIVVTGESVSAQASMADLVNRQFPAQLYTPQKFPMLVHV